MIDRLLHHANARIAGQYQQWDVVSVGFCDRRRRGGEGVAEHDRGCLRVRCMAHHVYLGGDRRAVSWLAGQQDKFSLLGESGWCRVLRVDDTGPGDRAAQQALAGHDMRAKRQRLLAHVLYCDPFDEHSHRSAR